MKKEKEMLAVLKLHLSTCLLLMDIITTDFFLKIVFVCSNWFYSLKNLIIYSKLLWVFNCR